MKKENRLIVVSGVVIVLLALLLSVIFTKCENSKAERQIKQAGIFSFAGNVRKEKSFFTKVKDKIFGSREEKIVKEYQELYAELEKKLSKLDTWNMKKDDMSKLEEIRSKLDKLSDEYYDLTGRGIYEVINGNTNYEVTKEKTNLDMTNEEDLFAKEKNTHTKNLLLTLTETGGYTLEKDSQGLFSKLFSKIKGERYYKFKTEDKENEEKTVEVISSSKKAVVKGFNEKDLLISKTEYIYDKENNCVKMLGKMYDDDGKEISSRSYDKLDNKGIFEFADGRKWDYSIEDATQLKILVKETFPNGDVEEFTTVNGVKEGKATKKYANGDVENIFYKADKKNGKSEYIFKNGEKEVAYYKDDVLDGPAEYTYSDGYKEKYTYKNGKRID